MARLSSAPSGADGRPGHGSDEAEVALKAEVVGDALQRLDGGEPPLEVLRRVEGRELAAIAGAAEAAMEAGTAIVVDGFIVTAALLAAVQRNPSSAST